MVKSLVLRLAKPVYVAAAALTFTDDTLPGETLAEAGVWRER